MDEYYDGPRVLHAVPARDGEAAERRTNLCGEVVPLEVLEVLQVPQVVPVRGEVLAAQLRAVQTARQPLRHRFVRELDPPGPTPS
jgi:hypothetical protein